jgi:hypothetical protein
MLLCESVKLTANAVSWTSKAFTYFIHTMDRA